MTSLRPHQQQLLNVLQDAGGSRLGLISSPPGSGTTAAVEAYLRPLASTSLVLILSSATVMTQQWISRLQEDLDFTVVNLDSASIALDVLDNQRPSSGIVVATYRRAEHGVTSQALTELDFDIIVHNHPLQPFSENVERLNSRARRAIALIDENNISASVPPDWPLLWKTTYDHLVRDGQIRVTNVPAYSTAHEQDIRSSAINLLTQVAESRNHALILPSDNIPSLHVRLLALASDADTPVDLADQAWAILDRIEGSTAADTRLAALDRALAAYVNPAARCIIIAATYQDAEYIADHLRTVGQPPRAVISGAMSRRNRESALADLAPGQCLVSTGVIGASPDSWPPSAIVVLWPAKRNERVRNQLSLIAEDPESIKVFEIVEQGEVDPSQLDGLSDAAARGQS